MFEAVGRFAVRARWAVVVGWLVLTAAAVAFLPSLGSVIRNDNVAFLPPDAPSVLAAGMAAPFASPTGSTGILVLSRSGGAVTAADEAAAGRLAVAAGRVPHVSAVSAGAVSGDRRALSLVVTFDPTTLGGGPVGRQSVDAVRATFPSATGADGGLEAELTGSLPILVDQQGAAAHTAGTVQLVSAALIILLLILAFRSFLAPLVTLAPAVVSLTLAGPLIAESTHLGVQISSLLQLLLTALVLGAGTDYGLFLLYRYREQLGLGLEPADAVVAALGRVGVSIAFSAATVIAALLSLLLAGFGLYRGVGPGLAVGVAVVLLVELTLFPALLAIFGRAVFWPSAPRPGRARTGLWGAIAVRVTRRPGTALAVGVVLLGGLSLLLVDYAPSGFNPGGAIAGSDSGAGEAVFEAHFGIPLDATGLLFTFTGSVWTHPQVLVPADDDLLRTGQFTSVTGVLDGGGFLSPSLIAAAYRRLGPPQDLPLVPPAHSALTGSRYNAYRALAGFVSADGRTVLFQVTLTAGSPGSTAALQGVPAVRRAVAAVAAELGADGAGVAGQAPGAADVSAVSTRDVVRIVPVVLLVLALLLALVLRSLVAPVYLVLSVALSYLAALGLAVGVFVVAGHQLGVNFTLPFFLFVFVMALGEDYNILVMSRIREEADRLPPRDAVAAALASTGTTVTTAGLILAGTFGVLALTTSGQVRQIGTGLSLGILIDTFIVRTLLVPSAAALLGRWNWWPGSGFRLRPGGEDRTT